MTRNPMTPFASIANFIKEFNIDLLGLGLVSATMTVAQT
jgi:hypothetical protein